MVTTENSKATDRKREVKKNNLNTVHEFRRLGLDRKMVNKVYRIVEEKKAHRKQS